MIGKGSKVKIWIYRVLLGSLLSLTAFVIFIGAYIEKNYEKDLPEDFFSLGTCVISPRFYVYSFSDRTERVGTYTDVTEQVYSDDVSRYTESEEMPKNLKNAFIAIEDKHFYDHGGIDWLRTVEAAANYYLGFTDRFGASTITQQTVKNLTGNREVTKERKLQEILYALELERELDKDDILELYLNAISYSDNCYGIAAAASHYFGKDVEELSLSECASLAAIVNSPTFYNPINYPENNQARRDLILTEMLSQGMISQAEYKEAIDTPIQTKAQENGKVRSWYVDMVLEDVSADLQAEYGISSAEAYRRIYTGGLKIFMAMDPEIQEIAEHYYESQISLPVNQNGNTPESALIAVHAQTGDILCVVGGVGEKSGNLILNYATEAKRSPGSSIKPLSVYAPALENNLITWASVYDDVPVAFNGGATWPNNATRVYRGLTDISYAVAHSTNTVAVRVLNDLGTNESFIFAKNKFHLKSLLDGENANDKNTVALALGQLQYGVTLREMTTAYTVFADGGNYHSYRSYYRVLDENNLVVLSNGDDSERVLSEGNAAVMTKLLEGVVKEGTSSSVTLDEWVECAGKTGTTSDDMDRWFIGYTPELVCGVWCGYPYPESLVGKNICTTIWNDVMKAICEVTPQKTSFDLPQNLIQATYCKDSGCLCSELCHMDARGDREAVGWFVAGTEPKSVCQCHILCDFDREGGLLHESEPEEYVVHYALIQAERHFPTEVIVTDAQYVYRGDPYEISVNESQNSAYFAENLTDFCGISGLGEQFNRSSCVKRKEENWLEKLQRYFSDE